MRGKKFYASHHQQKEDGAKGWGKWILSLLLFSSFPLSPHFITTVQIGETINGSINLKFTFKISYSY